MPDEKQGVMQVEQKVVEVPRQPWYVELHLGTHFITLCSAIVAFFSNGGHLPNDLEGWISFGASLGLWVFGVGVSINGSKRIS